MGLPGMSGPEKARLNDSGASAEVIIVQTWEEHRCNQQAL